MICIMKDDIYILEYLVMPLQSLQPLQSVRDGHFYSNHKIWKHIVGLVYNIIIPIADTQTDAVWISTYTSHDMSMRGGFFSRFVV